MISMEFVMIVRFFLSFSCRFFAIYTAVVLASSIILSPSQMQSCDQLRNMLFPEDIAVLPTLNGSSIFTFFINDRPAVAFDGIAVIHQFFQISRIVSSIRHKTGSTRSQQLFCLSAASQESDFVFLLQASRCLPYARTDPPTALHIRHRIGLLQYKQGRACLF